MSNTVRTRGGAPRHLLQDERRELGDVVRADDEIDVADPLEELLALLLRDAAGDGDDEVGPRALQRRELADLAPELLLGLLAHAARVEDDQVGVLGPLDRRASGRAQAPPSMRSESCTFIWQPNVWTT